MLKTPPDLLQDIADRIRARRVALGWPQEEAARRAGVAYRTWRRLETEGRASMTDMVKAAIALRCEHGLAGLFPEPAATSLEELLKRQARRVGAPASRPRARPRRAREPREPST